MRAEISQIKEWTTQKGAAAAQKYTLDYDPASQLKSGKLTNVSTSALVHQSYYDYDPAGNRTSAQEDTAVSTATANVLNQVTGTSAGGTVRFKGTLNEPGKVTLNGQSAWMSQGGLQFEGSVSLSVGTNTVSVVAKDASNNVRTNNFQVTVPSGSGKTFTYDLAGNMTSDGASTYAWDALNRLVKITYAGGATTEFTYDALSRRVKIVEKNNAGTVTETRHQVWEGMQIAEQREAAGNLVRRYYPSGYVTGTAAAPATSEKFVYLKDHLGSIRAVYGSSGISVYQDFDLWGNLTLTAGTSSTPADFGYTGHYYHAVSGLVLAPYRAYSPALGRWQSRDPLRDAEIVEGLNLYEYVINSPTNLIDPDGLQTSASCSPSGAATLAMLAQMAAESGVGTGAGIAASATCPPKKDPCKGLRDQLAAHQKKLQEYSQNPEAFDNKGFLKNTSPERRQNIIDGRVKNLQKQIDDFAKQLAECEKKNGM